MSTSVVAFARPVAEGLARQSRRCDPVPERIEQTLPEPVLEHRQVCRERGLVLVERIGQSTELMADQRIGRGSRSLLEEAAGKREGEDDGYEADDKRDDGAAHAAGASGDDDDDGKARRHDDSPPGLVEHGDCEKRDSGEKLRSMPRNANATETTIAIPR